MTKTTMMLSDEEDGLYQPSGNWMSLQSGHLNREKHTIMVGVRFRFIPRYFNIR